MKRVVVTGASGFIGRETLGPLLERGFEVHTLGRNSVDVGTHHTCDLFCDDVRSVLTAIAPTHLLHLAWNAEPGRFWSAPDNLDWVAASLRLTRAFAEAGGKRVAFAGTCAEYDWTHETLDEKATPLTPSTLYGTAKVALYRTIEAAKDAIGLSYVWGRIFFPYGPTEKGARLLPSVIDGLAAGRPVLCSEGLQKRDFLHVEDVGRAFVELLSGDIEGAVNIASGECIALREIVAKAARHAGDPALVKFGARPMMTGEPQMMNASIARLVASGFRPRFTLDTGLADMVSRRLSALANTRSQ